MKCIMNDVSRNTVKGNSPLNIDSFEVTQSILSLEVAPTFEKSSRGRSTVPVEKRRLSCMNLHIGFSITYGVRYSAQM